MYYPDHIKGNTMPLKNYEWQQIPETKNGFIYPLMRKPDITSSNSFIIRDTGHLIIIDPGADKEQFLRIEEIISPFCMDIHHPILMITSHAHMDHLYQGLIARKNNRFRYILCVQEYGANALETGNHTLTAADLINMPFEKISVDIHLLTKHDRQNEGERTIQISGLPPLLLRTQSRLTESGIPLISQQILFGAEEPLEIWYTPGHSKDSICISYGGFIHLGDIPFATNPAVAGTPGWEPAELAYTLERVFWIFCNRPVSVICSGHGNAQQYHQMYPHLERMVHELAAMPDIIRIDTTHVRESVQYALDLIDEAHRIFPVIAGRIMVLSYHLEDLGEECTAAHIASFFEGNTIDDFLHAFDNFYDAYRNGEKIELQVLLKGLQILKQIETNFPANTLALVIDPSMLRRASRLFQDFLTTLRGLPPKRILTDINPSTVLESVIQARITPQISDDDFLLAAEDEESFRAALVNRIAHGIKVRTLSIDIQTPRGVFPIIADKERFSDFFAALFEQYEVSGTRNLTLCFTHTEEKVGITLHPETEKQKYEMNIPGALIREVRSAGGWIEQPLDPKTAEIGIAFPSAISPV